MPGHLVALELNGKLLVGGRPELYPLRLPLRPAERVALARAGARLRLAVARYERAARPRPGESPTETRRRIVAHGDDQTFAEWLGPLPGDADLMFRATVTRSTAEPEEITAGAGAGYFALVWSSGGGPLAQHRRRGRRAHRGRSRPSSASASSPRRRGARGRSPRASSCACATARPARSASCARATRSSTAKAFDAARMIRDLPAETSSALSAIPYGPTVVMAMLTNETRPMPWDDLYALATPKRSFNMLFNTVNVLRPRSRVRAPGGSLMVYRAAHAAAEMLEQPDAVDRAGLPRRPLRDLPRRARDRERDDPAQDAAHAALRRARPLGAPARARALARARPPGRRLSRRRLHGHRDLERAGGGAGGAGRRCRPPCRRR